MTMDGKPRRQTSRSNRLAAHAAERIFASLLVPADAGMRGTRAMQIAPPLEKTTGEYFRKRRLRPGQAESPRRIAVSGCGTLHPAVKDFPKSIFAGHCADHPARRLKKSQPLCARADEVKICDGRKIHFRVTLRRRREKWNVKRLLCIGENRRNKALLQTGLVNEIHLTSAENFR